MRPLIPVKLQIRGEEYQIRKKGRKEGKNEEKGRETRMEG